MPLLDFPWHHSSTDLADPDYVYLKRPQIAMKIRQPKAKAGMEPGRGAGRESGMEAGREAGERKHRTLNVRGRVPSLP